MDIKKTVSALVRKCGSRDPFDIIQQLNVILVYYPLKDVHGFYQYFQRNNLIYIDESLPIQERYFVCAHELGHMLLHKKINAVFLDSRTFLKSSKYEIEADRFAMNLLLPDCEIEQYLSLNYEQLSRLFGYQQKLIELRIKDFI